MMPKEKVETHTSRDISKPLPVNPLEPLPIVRAMFLAYLRHHPYSSGYDLMKLISDSTDGVVDLQTGTVYSELRRLESMNLVSSAREKSGRRRRAYAITSEGEDYLQQLVMQMRIRVETVIIPLINLIESEP